MRVSTTRTTWIPDQVGYDKTQSFMTTKDKRQKTKSQTPASGKRQAASVHHHRLLGQAGVTLEGVFDFFLGGGVLLPGLDLLLEHFGP
ncbi:MAG: hypothetical protein RJB17_1201 [Pseudomonadota bacterium]